MGRRKGLTKKTRFEVFKRDNFTCQYCGKKAPEVILEVDHIKPVCKEGKNDIMNLITSCFDCNRGKGKRQLNDKTEVEKQRQQMEMLNEKRLQFEMLLAWRHELRQERQMEINAIANLLEVESGYMLEEDDKTFIAKAIHEFGFETVCNAAEIAVLQYIKRGGTYWLEQALKKLGGICYNLANGCEKRIYGKW